MTEVNPRSVHLPYSIDEAENRNHYYENYWKRVALDLLLKHQSDVTDLTLLDYGCGRGETLTYASNLGMKPTGLDIDPECVRIAAQKGNVEILRLDDLSNQLGEKSYDVVTCFHVLEHVENPKEVLSLLKRAARKYVIVAVPNLRQINNLRRPRVEAQLCNEGHLQSWDHPHFRNLAENHCGLKIVDWGFDATLLPLVSEIIRRTFGTKAVIHAETGIFKTLFPYNCVSVIALMRPI
ncbi:MAG: class I SAM-dependent methyltransferase [Verrucomicrobiota bacterium]